MIWSICWSHCKSQDFCTTAFVKFVVNITNTSVKFNTLGHIVSKTGDVCTRSWNSSLKGTLVSHAIRPQILFLTDFKLCIQSALPFFSSVPLPYSLQCGLVEAAAAHMYLGLKICIKIWISQIQSIVQVKRFLLGLI